AAFLASVSLGSTTQGIYLASSQDDCTSDGAPPTLSFFEPGNPIGGCGEAVPAPVVFDACDPAPVVTPTPPPPDAPGVHAVHYEAKDRSDNIGQLNVFVTVPDVRPRIRAPNRIVVAAAAGDTSALVDVGTPVVEDPCATPAVTGARDDGLPLTAAFPI